MPHPYHCLDCKKYFCPQQENKKKLCRSCSAKRRVKEQVKIGKANFSSSFDYDSIVDLCKKNTIKLLTTKENFPTKKKGKIEFICICGEKQEKSLTYFIPKPLCGKCAIRRGLTKTTDFFNDVVKKTFEENNYILISEKCDYKNASSELKYICDKNHKENSISWNHFQQGHRCPDCALENMTIPYEEVVEFFNKKNCQLLEKNYINNRQDLLYRCRGCYTEYTVKFHNAKHKKWNACKFCYKQKFLNIPEELPDIIYKVKEDTKYHLTDEEIKEKGWIGGHLAGCIIEREKCYQVFFNTGGIKCSKSFSFGKNNSLKEMKLKEAQKWRMEISDGKDLTKNKYRIVRQNNHRYVQIRLQDNLFTKLDLEDFDKIKKYRLFAVKNKERYYVSFTSETGKKRMLHNYILPEYKQIDHISRNGLDNRRQNLRDGRVVNPQDKGIQNNNTTEIRGVVKEEGEKPRYKAMWHEEGQRYCMSFSIEKYGEEGAKIRAINQRRFKERQLNLLGLPHDLYCKQIQHDFERKGCKIPDFKNQMKEYDPFWYRIVGQRKFYMSITYQCPCGESHYDKQYIDILRLPKEFLCGKDCEWFQEKYMNWGKQEE